MSPGPELLKAPREGQRAGVRKLGAELETRASHSESRRAGLLGMGAFCAGTLTSAHRAFWSTHSISQTRGHRGGEAATVLSSPAGVCGLEPGQSGHRPRPRSHGGLWDCALFWGGKLGLSTLSKPGGRPFPSRPRAQREGKADSQCQPRTSRGSPAGFLRGQGDAGSSRLCSRLISAEGTLVGPRSALAKCACCDVCFGPAFS